MEFLGLIVMQNKIKEETAGVLLDLRQANIRSLMVTGNPAVSVVFFNAVSSLSEVNDLKTFIS